MHISKPNISAFVMLIIVATPLLLSVGFLLNQFAIGLQMEYELEHAEAQKFTLPVDKIHWMKKDKEILLDGRFFDLKSFVIINDSIVVTGIFDKAEDELNEKNNKLIQHKKKAHFHFDSLAFLLIFNTTLTEYNPGSQPLLLKNINKKNPSRNENTVTQFFPVSTPPPLI